MGNRPKRQEAINKNGEEKFRKINGNLLTFKTADDLKENKDRN